MDSEERALLERTAKLGDENNRILKKMERRARWAFLWWFIKVLIIVVPLVIGYFYLEPYINQALDSYKAVSNIFNTPR